MRTYSLDFVNDTNDNWTMAVYQQLPDSVGLDSVSWLQTTAPAGGRSRVQFDLTNAVVLAEYSPDRGGIYRAAQQLVTGLGTAWEVVFQDGVQQLRAAGSSPGGDQIVISNISNGTANAGIGLSGRSSVYKRDLGIGGSARFHVAPTYFVGLFRDLLFGQVISTNVVVGPLILSYPAGTTQATCVASLEGTSIALRIDYPA